ncbi:MAG: hypothetical protein Q8R36_01820 [bacterium]|nr:hypothetical protein [bacterium]
MILKNHNWLLFPVSICATLVVFILLWQSHFPAAATCDETGVNRQQCFAEEIEKVLKTGGLSAAFDALIVFSKQDANFATACHGNVHEIGKAAYYRYADGEKIEYTPKMSYCGYGFFHGFMETLLIETGDFNKAVEFCTSFDENFKSTISGGTNACFHGIGHGAVDGSDPRVWDDPSLMIREAMGLCAQLPKENYAQHLCETGAYNSLEILSQDSKYDLKSLSADPYAFCSHEPRSRRGGCYTNMIPAVLIIFHNDFKKVIQYMLPQITNPDDLTIGNARVDEMAILALFHEFIRLYFNKPEEIGNAIELCREFESDRLHFACIQGLSGGHMKYDTPESAYENWRALCENSSLHEDERRACFEHVLSRISLWYESDRAKRICQSVPKQYQNYCPKKILPL